MVVKTHRLRCGDETPVNIWVCEVGLGAGIGSAVTGNNTQVAIVSLVEASCLNDSDTQGGVLSQTRCNGQACCSSTDDDIIVSCAQSGFDAGGWALLRECCSHEAWQKAAGEQMREKHDYANQQEWLYQRRKEGSMKLQVVGQMEWTAVGKICQEGMPKREGM